jgi:predicted enzyme related to lactoylglutathione lyase
MSIRRVVPNIGCFDIDASRKFYTELFGFRVAMDMGWIVTLVSPSNPTAQISLAKGTASEASRQSAVTISIEVADVDQIHQQAVAMGVPIVYPLTDEPWRVRRFGVIDPNGVTINVMSHKSQSQPEIVEIQ